MLGRRRVRVLAAVCGTVSLLGGCTRTGADGPRQGPSAAPSVVAIVPGAGPQAWAAAMYRGCAGREFDPKLACYSEAVVAVLRTGGVVAAMETVDRLAERDPEAGQHGHVLAHVVGLSAYRSADQVGAVFAECTPAYQSGCYHGVIQAYFAELQHSGARQGPPGATELNRLCADYRGPEGDRWLLFQCVHGMGHGLVSLLDYQLPRALEACDRLADTWEQEVCYGGAFMENLVNATMPHHAPGGGGTAHALGHTSEHLHHHADAHPHADHDADHGAARAESFKALDPADPHHPCSAVEHRYLNACYAMQTSAVLLWSNGDPAAGIRLCEEAPEQVRATCYGSLGRDLNAYTRQNSAAAIEKCLLVPERHQPACLIGVAKNRIDVTADADDGVAFCRAVPGGPNRLRCFQAVGEQVAVLERDPGRRAAFCARLEAADARGCQAGAGVRVP